ncbi:hypothetical protein, partial [Klebsiella quasipneumoniae]|uniref:hypothetical protein n=1 Tax=Klebsiella quasipneumoniae TaxID=1463165 RepID=UPI001D0D436B
LSTTLYSKESGLSVSFTALCQNLLRRGFCYLNTGNRMNDCPRRYTQKKAAYRSVATISIKPLDEGVYF